MKKLFLSVFIVFVVLCSISASVAIDNTDSIVNDNISVSNKAASFSQLQEDINAVEEGGILNLQQDYAFNSSVDSEYVNGVLINNLITINGNGHTISGSNQAKIFTVYSNNVYLANISLINGFSSTNGDFGAAIRAANAVTLYGNTLFENNILEGSMSMGSAISAVDVKIIGKNSFINNYASVGGAIYTTKNLEIYGSSLFDSNIGLMYGGAIYSEGTLTLVNGTFLNNKATQAGGAIRFQGTTLYISDCYFEKNNASLQGGAISFSSSKSANILNSRFFTNAANLGAAISIYTGSNLTISSCDFLNNYYNNKSNAIYNEKANLNVEYSSFANNGILNEGTLVADYNYWLSNNPDFSSLIIGASAPKHFVILKADTSNLTVGENVLILSFVDEKGNVLSKNVSNNFKVNLEVINGTVNPKLAIFNSNYAKVNYKATNFDYDVLSIYSTVSKKLLLSQSFDIKRPDNCFTELNRLIQNAIAKNLTIINLNKDYKFYNIIDDDYVNGIVIKVPITINGNGYSINASSLARIFNVNADSFTINNLALFNGYSSSSGGAIYSTGNVIIGDSNKLRYNYAKINGGAIYALSDVTVKGEDNLILENSALYDGGAIYSGANVFISSRANTLSINVAKSGNGGAIYSKGKVTANYVLFYKNSAKNAQAIFSMVNSDLNYNYWGSNNPKFESLIVGSINPSLWIVMQIEGPDLINASTDISYNVTLNKLNNGSIIENTLNSFYVVANTAKGTVHPSGVIINNGIGSFILNIPNDTKLTICDMEGVELLYKYIEATGLEMVSNDVEMYYKNGTRFEITLIFNEKPLAGAEVVFKINGQKYTRTTDSNGKASIALNLNAGSYTCNVSYSGSYGNISVENNVLVKSTIYGKDIVKTYRNDTQYYAQFIDGQGNVLANTQVSFNINGVHYIRTTDEKGIAKLTINLNPDIYIITATSTNGEQISNTITVLNSISGEDVIKMYRNGTQYFATFYGKDGKVLTNTQVSFNINGVYYTRTTDNNGVARMNINLNVGEYIITAINPVTGETYSNTITVKPILLAKDLSKYYGESKSFDATALDDKGNPAVGVEIIFNINGVFYKKITNEKGVAKLNINLIPGSYIITSYWNNFVTSNNVNILATDL